MTEKVEPFSRAIIENMVAAGCIYWRRPVPLIPHQWLWALVAIVVVIIVVAVILFPS